MISNHLAFAFGRGLKIILVEVNRQRSTFNLELHQSASRILNIDLQVTPLPADCEYHLRNVKKGVKIIELVYLRQYDSPTLVSARGIHLTVILVGMPIGKIFTNRGANRKEISQGPGVNDFSEFS